MEQKCILVVDDEPHSRDGLVKILRRSGYNVISADNGADALEKIKEVNCDLVITDIRMPAMDGMQLLREIKKTASDIDVIMITAFGEVESYIEAMNVGAFEYLNKPIRVDELRRVICKVLYDKRFEQDKPL